MPSVTITRPDLFPNGTTVGIYPNGAKQVALNVAQIPTAAAIATGVVASESVTITNASILQGVDYQAYAQVGGQNNYLKVRSTLDVSDVGRAAGSGTTVSGSPIVTGVANTSGQFATGQRISTTTASAAIPPGTYIKQAATSFTGGAVTGTAATDVFTKASHGLRVGDPVVFSGLTGGAGLTAGAGVYVISVPDANTFKVSATRGGPALDITTDLTAGTLTGALVMTQNAGASGAQTLTAEGGSPGQVPPNVGVGATERPVRSSTWAATVRQRRATMGTESAV